MRHVLALLLIPLALDAQQLRCTVEGMVASAATRDAVRRALVYLRRTGPASHTLTGSSYTASTDPLGKFLIEDVEPGTFVLSAERSGFATAFYSVHGSGGPGTPLKLEGGHKSGGPMILMTPHAVISGKVVDEYGDPVVSADVRVSTLAYSIGRKQMSRAGGATTNDLGEYRVFGLPAGKYWVSAASRSNPVLSSAEEYVTTYYPRATDAGSASPVDVPAGGQLRNIDVTMSRTRVFAVRGRVTCEVEGQNKMLNAMLVPRFLPGLSSMSVASRGARVVPDGSFEILAVAPGAYTLMAVAKVDGKDHVTRVPVQVGGSNIEGLQVFIRQGATVNGRLRVDGRPQEPLAGWTVGLQPWESGGILLGAVPKAQTAEDGSFQLQDVAADRFNLYVTGLPEGYYIKSARSGGADVIESGLEVGGGSATLDVVISPNAGGLEGTATDPREQKPAAGVTVVLVPRATERMTLYKTAVTDESGRFRMKSLVPGDYRIYAWESVPQNAWTDPDFMRPYQDKGDAVSIPEGSPQSVQVTVIQ